MEDFGLLVGRYYDTFPTLTDTQLAELLLDARGRLIISGRYLEDSAHNSGNAGLFVMAVANHTEGALHSDDGDYAPFQVDSLGRLRVVADIDVNGFPSEKQEDAAHSSGDTGMYVLAVRQDTLASSTDADGDYASFKVNSLGELYVTDSNVSSLLTTIDSVLDSIKVDTGNIDTSLNNIEADLDSLVHLEDSQHTSGDAGMMPLAVRNDADTSLVDADGDYAPLQVDADGRLKISGAITVDVVGSEEYTVTDALAAAGDGLETITAAATPWVTVASFLHESGIAYIFGYQWACDQNAQMRLITDDTTNIVVYKTDINSSATPGTSEHFGNEGRIEITGAANLEIKMQIKKRGTPGGNANGTGSIHIRK